MVSLTWIPFRAQGFDNLAAILGALTNTAGSSELAMLSRVVVVMAITLFWHIASREIRLEQRFDNFSPMVKTTVIALLMVCVGIFSTGDSRAFIYFQF
jgi:alginate O-acetyltransferase complex protein AlgI